MELSFPALEQPYLDALHEAVDFILNRFQPLGLVAAGSIVRGDPGPSSDLDLYVLHAPPWRQRVQKFFHGVPCEIFVNPRQSIEDYLRSEHAEGKPITAHMLATGHVVLDHPLLGELRSLARELLETPPTYSTSRMLFHRYMAATRIEDALDMAARSPHAALMIMSAGVHDCLAYRVMESGGFLPREKDLPDVIQTLDPDLRSLFARFCSPHPTAERLELGEQIAMHVLGVRGFFEWESQPHSFEEG